MCLGVFIDSTSMLKRDMQQEKIKWRSTVDLSSKECCCCTCFCLCCRQHIHVLLTSTVSSFSCHWTRRTVHPVQVASLSQAWRTDTHQHLHSHPHLWVKSPINCMSSSCGRKLEYLEENVNATQKSTHLTGRFKPRFYKC